MNFGLVTFGPVTFGPVNFGRMTMKLCLKQIKNFGLVTFGPVNYGPVTDGQTDRQKVMHMSPPCLRTGGLKNTKIRTEIPGSRRHPKKYLVSEGTLKNTSHLEFYPLKILLSPLSVYARSHPPGQ